MSQICPNCQKENADDARFCFHCGASISDEGYEAGQQALAGQPAAPDKPPRRLNWRCCGAGCLVILLVLLVGLPVLHITVIRPAIQNQLIKLLKGQAGNTFEFRGCFNPECIETITESQLNDSTLDLWDQVPGARGGKISLKQDEIAIKVTIYGIDVEAGADVRVDKQGDVVVKSVRLNSAMSLLFEKEKLAQEIANFVNDKLVQPNDIKFLAFQVVDGEIYTVYTTR